MTALLERETSGEGQWVQSSLLHVADRADGFPGGALPRSKARCREQVGNDHPTRMPTSAYTTADGYINIARLGRQAMWERLCRGARPRRISSQQPEFMDGPAARRTARALNAEIERGLRDAHQRRVGRAAQRRRRALRSDLRDGPGVRRSAGAAPRARRPPVQHPRLGELQPRQPGGEALAHAGDAWRAATPERGEHTDEILRELGYDNARIGGCARAA